MQTKRTTMKLGSSFLATQFSSKGSLQLANYLLVWNSFPGLILLDHLRLLIDDLQVTMLVIDNM
jgi:hypothetical protein